MRDRVLVLTGIALIEHQERRALFRRALDSSGSAALRTRDEPADWSAGLRKRRACARKV